MAGSAAVRLPIHHGLAAAPRAVQCWPGQTARLQARALPRWQVEVQMALQPRGSRKSTSFRLQESKARAEADSRRAAVFAMLQDILDRGRVAPPRATQLQHAKADMERCRSCSGAFASVWLTRTAGPGPVTAVASLANTYTVRHESPPAPR